MPDELWRRTALYTDGGCIAHNPSPIGGTWAWVLVVEDEVAREVSGFIPGSVDHPVTNNLAEYVAAVNALEAMPLGWSGYLCSDSQVTLGRLFQDWHLVGIPLAWSTRAAKAMKRLGTVKAVLLQGHPTKADLARGIGAKRNLPVSKWNALCDKRCQEKAAEAVKA